MKPLLTILLWVLCFSQVWTQTPLLGDEIPNTRAVVVGISDYQQSGIPDLNFAHADAIAFADWLRSPAGGSVPEENILLHTNEAATNAQIIMSISWLIENSVEGDRVFIYFSGHGDVESVTKYSKGYLLGYDSPVAVYGAGAFAVDYFKALIGTLSENGVQVIVIADACRAGKLAGSTNNGKQYTAENLSSRWGNEIMILSCHPDETSLEGMKWGGGRGCFSYHLENALYGFADLDQNEIVELSELRRYLEDKVSEEAAPDSQVPKVDGPPKAEISYIDKSILEKRTREKSNESLAFLDTQSKGQENLIIEKLDTSVQNIYKRFHNALDSGDLMRPEGKCANDYYRELLKFAELKPVHGSMTRKLVVALITEGQEIVNRILLTDPHLLDSLWTDQLTFDHLPNYYQRARELLGESHYMSQQLKTRELYFRSKSTHKGSHSDKGNAWIFRAKRKYLKEALDIDPANALIHFEMGEVLRTQGDSITYLPNSINLPRRILLEIADIYYAKAQKFAPNWVLPYYNSGAHTQDFRGRKAIQKFRKAIAVDPGFLPAYFGAAETYDRLFQFGGGAVCLDSALYFKEVATAKFFEKRKDTLARLTSYDCRWVGNYLLNQEKYEDAKEVLLLGEELSHGKNKSIYYPLAKVYTELQAFEKAADAYQKSDAESTKYLRMATLYHHYMGDKEKAIQALNTHFEVVEGVSMFGGKSFQTFLLTGDPAHSVSPVGKWRGGDGKDHFYAGEMAARAGQKEMSEWHYEKVLEQETHGLFLWLALTRLGKTQECMQQILVETERHQSRPKFHLDLARFFAYTSEQQKALKSFRGAIDRGWEPYPLSWWVPANNQPVSLCDPLLDPIRKTDTFQKLVRTHFPEYYEVAMRK